LGENHRAPAAQIIYYLGENLAARAAEFYSVLQQTGASDEPRVEVDAAIDSCSRPGLATNMMGVHNTPIRNVVSDPESIGVMAILCPDDQPLLALTAFAASALAMGNTLVVVPSPLAPLCATDFYQVIETSDVPAGTFNLITGNRDELAQVLAEHDDVDVIWYAGPPAGQTMVERASAGNMKRTWVLPAAGPLPP
jgi:aldehyde dehydrogenase (NAD+)